MYALMGLWDKVLRFTEVGGPVIWGIAVVLFVMWAMIIERWIYLQFVYPKEARQLIGQWHARQDTTSWQAHRIREAWLSQASVKLNARMTLIKTLVAVCPLIGLLGTVYGMIGVFEALASQGSGNPRLMAGGIFRATMPTMAGMVAAISGLFVISRLDGMARNRADQLADSMPHHYYNAETEGMARKQRVQSEDAQIDMTPMLDVVFIMLIFFITTASFVKEAGVNVRSPTAATADPRPKANIFVAVTAESTVWVDKRPVEVTAVRQAIERLRQEVPVGSVVIQADRESKSGVVVQVLDQVKAAGITDVSVAAAPGGAG